MGAETASPTEKPITTGYSYYVLALLFLVYAFSFIDRQILAILLESIKKDLDVSDTAMGFLTGPAFVVFYICLGIPIARWADHGSRRTIISIGLGLWSAMTVACGIAQNFLQLAAARVGVGVGEAAGSPPAHSLISDYFPPERRASALAIYGMGIYIGIFLGYCIGGYMDDWFSWRTAFLVVGAPGVLLALIVRFTIREPARGHADGLASNAKPESLKTVLCYLATKRSFVFLVLATSFQSLCGYGFMGWVPTFLRRVHELPSTEIGLWVGASAGLGGAIGSSLGGFLTDHLARRDVRWNMYLAAIVSAITAPLAIPFLFFENANVALWCYFPFSIFGAMYLGPMLAMTQGLARLRMRALASSILLFVVNMVGLGIGVQAIGFANDLLHDRYGVAAIRYSLLSAAIVGGVFATLFFLLASRTLKQDLDDAREVAYPEAS